MKIYKNFDGSYDIVSNNNILYHMLMLNKHTGHMRKIGHIDDRWKHPQKAVKTFPKYIDRILGDTII
jgi:hypothetical protein